MTLDGKSEPNSDELLNSKPTGKDTCSPLFLWTSGLILAITLVSAIITDPNWRDSIAFRDSLIGCLGAREAYCEPLHGNPIGTSQAGKRDSVEIIDGANTDEYFDDPAVYGGTILVFRDYAYRVDVTGGIVERIYFSGEEYFWSKGRVYKKQNHEPDSSGVPYVPQ